MKVVTLYAAENPGYGLSLAWDEGEAEERRQPGGRVVQVIGFVDPPKVDMDIAALEDLLGRAHVHQLHGRPHVTVPIEQWEAVLGHAIQACAVIDRHAAVRQLQQAVLDAIAAATGTGACVDCGGTVGHASDCHVGKLAFASVKLMAAIGVP